MKKLSSKKKSSKKKSGKRRARRRRLARATAVYFASLSGKELCEEQALGRALAFEASRVNFDE
jgi:hypothetical protein